MAQHHAPSTAPFVFPHSEAREYAINIDNIEEAHAYGTPKALYLRFVSGQSTVYWGETAMELWISLKLAEVVSDGDGYPKELVTPFGKRAVL
jgi:hypothetical protein